MLRSPFTILFIFIVLFSCSPARAGKIEKAFEALEEYNYFKAKELFQSSLRKNESPAAYGLATIYYRSDNPFHSLDSALIYIIRAEKSYANLSEKKKEKLKLIPFDYLNVIELRAKISSSFYALAKQNNSVRSYGQFVIEHPWANELFEAIHKRDSIAFELAKAEGSSSAFEKFTGTYPESTFYTEARNEFFRLQYQELTAANTLVAYLNFLKKCPESPYVHQAEDRVYELVTGENTVEAYHSFVVSYPSNRNVGPAWKKLYQLYMVDFSDVRLHQFREDYPEYPYWEDLEQDLALMKLQLLPFKSGHLYGFMDYSGKQVIPAQYEQLSFFREGLSLAMKDGLYGYIDKSNRVMIPFQYSAGSDFEQGRAVVELNGRTGMIDRNGNPVFPFDFEDIGSISDGLVYAKKDSLYGYYDINGNVRITPKYSDAYPFSKGIAKVTVNNNEAFIDEFGTYVVAPGYEEISFFNDSLLIFRDGELFGLMRKNCRVVVDAQYEVIGELSLNRALVVKEGKLGYIDGSGKEIVSPLYETFPNYLKRGQFRSNMAVVCQKGKYGVIDPSGKILLPLNNSDIGDPNSLIAFSKGKGWGFMDLTGKALVQPSYDFAESFQDGVAIVEKLTLQGVIDPKGKELIPITFTSISRITRELLLVSNGSQFGVMNLKGETIVPLIYQQIRVLDKDLLLLMGNNEVHYLLMSEKRIIQPLAGNE